MNPDKRIIIDDLTARVNASPFLIVVDYTSTRGRRRFSPPWPPAALSAT